jgi:hypothetical protein
MELSRPSRFVAALITLFSMLFMQYAVASYACPGMEMGQVSESVAMPTDAGNQTMQGMSGCEGMDAQQPSLCHAHDQVGNQSLDKPGLPDVQPFMAATLTVVFRDVEIAYSPIATQPDSPLLTRSNAPPLSIRNCCFRI